MKHIFSVSGMHCVSCETLLEKEVSEIPHVQKCKASHTKGTLEVECAGDIPKKEIEKIIKKCGYNNATEQVPLKKISGKDLLQIAGIFVGILLISALFSSFGISQFFPDVGKSTGILTALLMGFVASVSTCLALTGGIVMSFSSECAIGKAPSLWNRIQPQCSFHIGRLVGFSILGGILGTVGGAIQYSTTITGILTIVVAIIMLTVGLHILGLAPNITRFGIHFPKALSAPLSRLQRKQHPLLPGIIGVLTFFLPCGFTQSMQLAAALSGNFVMGALIMFFFALGTLPVLFSIGLGSSWTQNKDFGFFRKIVGTLLLFFSLISLQSGLVLAGSKIRIDFWDIAPSERTVIAETSSETTENEQIVTMDIDYTFQQTEFRVKKGVPVRWEINAIHATGCTDEVIIPRLGISSGKLKPGKNIVEFTPTESGTLPFSCWMGMQGGKFIVEE